MSDAISLVERRWQKTDDVAASSITDMLEVALAEIRRGDWAPTHAILCFGIVNDDGSVNTEWLQAGKLDPFAQLGLLERVKLGFFQSAD